jgi:hypothetical protein
MCRDEWDKLGIDRQLTSAAVRRGIVFDLFLMALLPFVVGATAGSLLTLWLIN